MQVMGATFDGASVNRRFVKMHDTSAPLLYKVINRYASDGRFLYFFSDPPHLIKTTRNCWASPHRTLWVIVRSYNNLIIMVCIQNDGRYISWQHLKALYNVDGGKATGLSIVKKLKFEHLKLTSFSKMRVDLAAQVSPTT